MVRGSGKSAHRHVTLLYVRTFSCTHARAFGQTRAETLDAQTEGREGRKGTKLALEGVREYHLAGTKTG